MRTFEIWARRKRKPWDARVTTPDANIHGQTGNRVQRCQQFAYPTSTLDALRVKKLAGSPRVNLRPLLAFFFHWPITGRRYL